MSCYPSPQSRPLHPKAYILTLISWEMEDCYVCWLDVMGTHNQMLRSLHTSANFIYKLQCAVLLAYDDLSDNSDIGLYPVMDGMYITSARRWPLDSMLKSAMRRLAETFIQARENKHRFLVRGAIVDGPMYHGRNVQTGASKGLLDRHPQQRNSILLGLPMAQAYRAESSAPPFGIAIDDSARAFSPYPDATYPFIWWNWFNAAEPPLDCGLMMEELESYFTWQNGHTNMTGYDPARMHHHQTLAKEYFGR